MNHLINALKSTLTKKPHNHAANGGQRFHQRQQFIGSSFFVVNRKLSSVKKYFHNKIERRLCVNLKPAVIAQNHDRTRDKNVLDRKIISNYCLAPLFI